MRKSYQCPCPQCAGDEPAYARHTEYCLQCGAELWPDGEVYATAGGMLHDECLAEYLLEDAKPNELRDFAEQHDGAFLRFMRELRDLMPERLSL